MSANPEPTSEQLREWLDRERAIADEAVGRMAKAEREWDEARDTVRSLACMLGWDNVPPRETLEHSVKAERVRLEQAEARVTALEGLLRECRDWVVPTSIEAKAFLADVDAALTPGGSNGE